LTEPTSADARKYSSGCSGDENRFGRFWDQLSSRNAIARSSCARWSSVQRIIPPSSRFGEKVPPDWVSR